MTSLSPGGRLPARQKQDLGLGNYAPSLHHMAISDGNPARHGQGQCRP